MIRLKLVVSVPFFSVLLPAQSILAVGGWTGTVRIHASQSGTGTTAQAGVMQVIDSWTHDSTAALTFSLSKDSSNARRWTGPAQGSVNINNENLMTMTAPLSAVVCTGTLFWIVTEPAFSGQATLEADATGLNYRLWITPNTIPWPDSGSVVCPIVTLTKDHKPC